MTDFMCKGNIQSTLRSREGKWRLEVDIYPEILLLLLHTAHSKKKILLSDINFLLFFFFLNLSADFYTSINLRIILDEMDVYYICAISS